MSASINICDWCGGDCGWHPIETAPDREDGVLVCDATKPNPAVGVARFIDGRWRGYDHGMGIEAFWPTPTHWAPLPAPPALAAAVRSTETRSRLGPQGRQSGGFSRNAQHVPVNLQGPPHSPREQEG